MVLFITFAVFQYFGLLVHQGGLDEWKSESSALCLSSGCPALSIKIFVFLVAALTYPLSFFPSCVHLCLLGHSCPLCLPFYLFANPPCLHPRHLSILSTPLSTLMRSRMTMNTLIIMRKQQAVPPPLHPPLPNLGPPVNR